MHLELETRKIELDKAWSKIYAELEKIDESKWQQKPSANEWSAIQVFEHIISSETGTLGYMKKKSSGGWESLDVTAEQHHTNSKAINERLLSNERYKAPDILPEPPNKISKEDLTKQIEFMRLSMQEFLVGIDPMHFDKLVFRQPYAGMLNILQTLEFLTVHIHHHIPQLHRIAISVS